MDTISNSPASGSKTKAPDPFDRQDIAEDTLKQLKKKRPNTDDLFAKAASMNVDPFEILLQIADGNKMALDLDDDEQRPISPELRAMAARTLLGFMYPTMKSAEVTGPGGSPLDMAVKVVFEGASESSLSSSDDKDDSTDG
jgi:hypothetical protein